MRSVSLKGDHQLAFTAGSGFVDEEANIQGNATGLNDVTVDDASTDAQAQTVPTPVPTPDASASEIQTGPVPDVPHNELQLAPQGVPLNGPKAGFRIEYSGGGVPLNEYSTGSGYGFGGYSGHGYGGYGYGRRHIGGVAVEIDTCVDGMRVSEYPSPTTGLTLTEEQHQAYRSGNGMVPGAAQSCETTCKRPYINIPDHVW
jgi:hypothetical protein